MTKLSIEQKDPLPDEVVEERIEISDSRNEMIEWWGNEVKWWSRLHNKKLDADHATTILDELITSGYTVRDGMINCVHERLRRHRFDLSITCFYPDSLTSSEILAAQRRSYMQGKKDAAKESQSQSVQQCDAETLDLSKHIASLYQRITELENDLLIEKKRNEKLQKL